MIKKIFLLNVGIYLWIACFSQPNKISIEDIWKHYKFFPNTVSGFRSMNNGIYYTTLENNSEIVQYAYNSEKKIATLFSVSLLNDSNITKINNYEISQDESKILIAVQQERIYRHSFRATYYIYDLNNKTIKPLSEKGKQQLATFSPDGKKVAFVRDNNLFIKDILSNIEIAVTNDGEQNKIINGAPDWVYEEEFSFSQAYAWSYDSKKIAYYKTNETEVKQFAMTLYGSLYPTQYEYKYPKAGEKNSIVTIYVYDLASKSNKLINTGTETDQYIPRIMWTYATDMLCVFRLNRLQNTLDILLANATTGETQIMLTEQNKAFIEITNDYYFLKDKQHFVYTSQQNGWNHIYLYNLSGKLIKQITNGEWEVVSIIGCDEANKIIYYQSCELSPLQRDIFAIKFDGTGKKKISEKKGCNDIVFSTGYKYYINYFSDANTPPYITLHSINGKLIRVLEDNSELKQYMIEYGFAKKEFFSFTNSDNIKLYGWIIKPLDFTENKKYPVYMYVYGGPHSQQVTDDWDAYLPWYQYLTQQGYIVVCVDNRGTVNRGEAFQKCTYMQLGKLETQDQIDAAKYLSTFSYIDANRIGIQGWSYGGYLSTLCITKGAKYFKAAIAVAPVTNWKYYDSIYTERYMRTPQENKNGYEENAPINFVNAITGKYLLIHGTADDNVHLQNTMELITALVKANKPFDLMIYPDKNHSIVGGNYRLHLFTKISDFIKTNL